MIAKINFWKEPTPNPSQEGNWLWARADLFPSWEGLGVGRLASS